MKTEDQILTQPWFIVQNGQDIDIHCRVFPENETPREITVASAIHSQAIADEIVRLHGIYCDAPEYMKATR